MPAQDAADGLRVRRLDRGDVQPELETGAPPRHPHHPVTERLAGQLFPVDGGGQGDPGIRVQVIHVRGVDQAVHRGVDARGGAALAVQAVVERRDHLVLPVHPGVHVDQGAQPVQPQHRQVLRGQGAEVTAGTLDPQQLHRLPGDRVGLGALRGGVPAGVVGVPRVGAQPVGPGDQVAAVVVVSLMKGHLLRRRRGSRSVRNRVAEVDGTGAPVARSVGCWRGQAPQLAWVPPTRSAATFAAYPESANACSGSRGRPRFSRRSARMPRTSVS